MLCGLIYYRASGKDYPTFSYISRALLGFRADTIVNYPENEQSPTMCYFDQYRFTCGDCKWGDFRQHCTREYRTGETCGIKYSMQTVPIIAKCNLCRKIDTKIHPQQAEMKRISPWNRASRESGALEKRREDIEWSRYNIECLDKENQEIIRERKRRGFDSTVLQSMAAEPEAPEKSYGQQYVDSTTWSLKTNQFPMRSV